MGEYLPLLLFIIFFVLPIVERVLKGGRKPPPEQELPPRQRPDARGREVEAEARRGMRHGLPGGTATEAESSDPAADMIPDDLWEILTGERRTRPAPQPVPVEDEPFEWEPDHGVDEYVDEVEAFEQERVHLEHHGDEARREALLSDRERAVHTAERAPVHKAPLLQVFDAANLPTASQRHAAFHRRIDAPLPPRRPRPAPVLGPIAGLSSAEMRRAVVLREVLGPPKALE